MRALADFSIRLRQALELVEQLLGLDRFERPLAPVHEQLGQPGTRQAQVLRNLFKLSPV